ncbi:hypothetical protein [Aquibacillus rhizosphaerae]|uniref:Uncharacterized protein n=1 Tax=Aquibacillus rhizosphaerae TaxID=3051431 RepID=A0ABT7L989_9BACI|nr:hypothetical protein [Aquibacillus sp. LR5S19]MDL4842430.1 hypothetical protein [Aquibacillus sp. LR5S19]
MKMSLIYVLLDMILYAVVITMMFVGFLGVALSNENVSLLPNLGSGEPYLASFDGSV